MSATWATYLLVLGAITTFFSLFTTPGTRRWRNVGILASYVSGVVMLVLIPVTEGLLTWAVIGLATGLLYLIYEVQAYLRTSAEERAEQPGPRPLTVLHGLFFWPIMLPEAIEYLLAELGLLGGASSGGGAGAA